MEIGGGPIFNFDPDFLPQIKRTNPLSQKHEVDALDCRGAALIIKLIDTYFDNWSIALILWLLPTCRLRFFFFFIPLIDVIFFLESILTTG